MTKHVLVALPLDAISRIDAEALRRKLRRSEASKTTPEEIEEAYRLAKESGTVAANAYLRERQKVRLAASCGSASRHGIVLELILEGIKSLPQEKRKKSTARIQPEAEGSAA